MYKELFTLSHTDEAQTRGAEKYTEFIVCFGKQKLKRKTYLEIQRKKSI